jgi:cell wall-associated NlpC family hydrolase
MTIEERERVIATAREWLRTPYHPNARLRGIGVDCAQFLIGVYHDAGLIPEVDTGSYSATIHLHQENTQYIETILRFAREIEESEVQPGDVVLYKVAHAWAHAGVIVRWPDVIIHAVNRTGVIESHGTIEGFVLKRPHRFFTLRN